MAEQLASLRQKGGDNMPNLGVAPAAKYTNDGMANNATATLAVSQKPKYIVACFMYSVGRWIVGIINVETNEAYRHGWNGTSGNYTGVWTNVTSFITSITDNSVSIKNSLGYQCNVHVSAYY